VPIILSNRVGLTLRNGGLVRTVQGIIKYPHANPHIVLAGCKWVGQFAFGFGWRGGGGDMLTTLAEPIPSHPTPPHCASLQRRDGA
jgi:hypothetical protein